MNREEFLNLLESPYSPEKERIGDVKEIIDLFPWFHTGHLLLLKLLDNKSDIRFENQLRQSAMRVPDREVLYYLLKSGPLAAKDVTPETEISEIDNSQLSVAVEPGAVIGSRSRADLVREIEQRLKEIDQEGSSADAEEREDPEQITSKGPELMELDESEEGITKSALTARQPDEKSGNDLLDFDEPDTASSSAADVPGSASVSQAELIERFILANPRIEQRRDKSTVEPAPLPDQDEPGLVTETLARIYTSQGYYTRAINIYERLCLKYPEKSDYFATQIKQIEDLIK